MCSSCFVCNLSRCFHRTSSNYVCNIESVNSHYIQSKQSHTQTHTHSFIVCMDAHCGAINVCVKSVVLHLSSNRWAKRCENWRKKSHDLLPIIIRKTPIIIRFILSSTSFAIIRCNSVVYSHAARWAHVVLSSRQLKTQICILLVLFRWRIEINLSVSFVRSFVHSVWDFIGKRKQHNGKRLWRVNEKGGSNFRFHQSMRFGPSLDNCSAFALNLLHFVHHFNAKWFYVNIGKLFVFSIRLWVAIITLFVVALSLSLCLGSKTHSTFCK